MHQLKDRDGDKFLHRISKSRDRPGVDKLNFAVLDHENRLIGIFDQRPIAFFFLPQRRLRPPAFGDIFNNPHTTDNAPALQMDRRKNSPYRRGFVRGDGTIHILIKGGLAAQRLPNRFNNLLIRQFE